MKYCASTREELTKIALIYRSSLWKRVKNKRVKKNMTSQNMPKVTMACCSNKSPFLIQKDYNHTTLKTCHQMLLNALPSPLGTKIPKNKRLFPKEDYFEVGHCAEFHASHKLLEKFDKKSKTINQLSLNDIIFGYAIKVSSGYVRPYCGTCKQTFSQLI